MNALRFHVVSARLLTSFFYLPPINQHLNVGRNAQDESASSTFRPLKFALAIEQRSDKPPVAAERYAKLCEIAAHVHPNTVPRAHNLLAVPVTGGVYQEIGFLASLNELALAVSITAGFAALLLIIIDKPVRQKILLVAKHWPNRWRKHHRN
jgi:hypothetical protein